MQGIEPRKGKILAQIPADDYADISVDHYRTMAADRALSMGGRLLPDPPEIIQVAGQEVELDGEVVSVPPMVNLIFSMVEVNRAGH